MALNKQQLEAVNQANFPDNNTQLITPTLLREFNTDMIDAIQLTGSYATTGSNNFVGNQTITGNLNVSGVISASVLHVQIETASVIFSTGSNQLGDELTDIQTLSGSVKIQGQLLINGVPLSSGSATDTGSLVTTASFNAYTQSANGRLTSLETNSASVNISITNLNQTTASLNTSVTALNSFTQSQQLLNGTFATTGSNTFTGNQIIDRASKLYTNGVYWTDMTAGYNNLEIINQGGGNLDFASLNGGRMRVVSTPLQLTGSVLSSNSDISTSANIYAANLTGSGVATNTGSLLVTASAVGNTITFTKGDASTFNVSVSSTPIDTGSLVSTASFNSYTSSTNSRLNNIETTTASLLIETQNLELFSASALVSISNLNTATSSLFTSASLSLTTASVSGQTMTFRKGDGTTFNVTLPAGGSGSIDTSSFATTGSNSFNGSQNITGSLTSSLDIRVAGVKMGFGNPLGTASIAIGTNTLANNTGNNNIAIGQAALDVNTTGNANVAISLDALGANTTGRENIAIGEGAFRDNVTGIQNTIIGHNAGLNAGNVGGNVIIGQGAGRSVKNGLNTIVGQTAALNITSGSGNTILGQAAGVNVGVGSNNTFIGQNAGRNISGSNNIVIGAAQGVGDWNSVIALSDGSANIRAIYNSGWVFTGSVDIQNTLTASLQQGFTYVGNAAGRTTLVATSSFGGGTTINTGSFVTTSSFNAYTQSTDSRLTNIESTTASLNTSVTNLNTFTASALSSISQLNASSASQQISIDNLNTTTASLLVETLNLELFSASALTSLSNLNTATASLFTSASLGLTTASFSGNTLTFTKGDNSTFGIVIPDVSGSTINTGSFATTGSNTFTGDQTFIDGANNFFTITDTSGSMMLVGKSMTSSSLHISSSAVAVGSGAVNLIFKPNNQTADTIISGSNNIFQNPAAPTAGFKRYLTSNNIALGGGFPQLSGSVQFSPNVTNNYFGGTLTMRLPVSSSTFSVSTNNLLGTFNVGQTAILNAERLTGLTNISTNFIAGNVNFIANQSEIRGTTTFTNNNINGGVILNLSSSAIFFNQNTINDGAFVFTNQYSSGSLGFGTVNFGNNTIAGSGNTLIVTGSQQLSTITLVPSINQNMVIGQTNIIFSNASTARLNASNRVEQGMVATSILGTRLNVSASSDISDSSTFGSVFVGRYNADDGIRNKSSDIVFAVGTGREGASNRKTGFHIDSGSNSFFEGAVNISGSLLVNGSPLAGIATGSFATTGSNTFVGNQTVSASVSIRGNTTFTSVSGDQSSVILGSDALGSSTGGSINVAIGNSAMKFASGSSQNVAIGNRALFKTTGSFNIAIGSETMTENTTGQSNVAIGLNALNVNTTGNENFALGSNSMMFTSGSAANSNIGIGTDTLTRNQTDSQIAIGGNALQRATTGNANTAIGRFAMTNTTTGYDNIAIGVNSMFDNTSGYRNTAIGKTSLRRNTTGNENVAIGYESLLENTTGFDNVAIGNDALSNNTTGNSNFALGNNSLLSNVGGNALIAIGAESGQFASGSSSTFIGHRAGKFVTGSANTIIGGFESTAGTKFDNNIILADGIGNVRARYNLGAWLFTNDINVTGSISIAPSNQVKFATGSNQQAGTAVLDGANPGTVTVSNSLVTTNSIIMLTKQTLTNSHMVAVTAKSGGSFTITSTGNGDTDTVGWFIINNS